jgi:hypothetical protein
VTLAVTVAPRGFYLWRQGRPGVDNEQGETRGQQLLRAVGLALSRLAVLLLIMGVYYLLAEILHPLIH